MAQLGLRRVPPKQEMEQESMIARPSSLMLIVALILALAPIRAWPEVFCVRQNGHLTPEDMLQGALWNAAFNEEDDEIRIETGTYVIPEGGIEVSEHGFRYDATEWPKFDLDGKALEISGGWMQFGSTPCGLRWTTNPQETIIDGNNTFRALDLRGKESTDFTVRYLTLINGDASSDDNNDGGGLFVYQPTDYDGNIVIENNIFIGNYATKGGGLAVDAVFSNDSTGKVKITNNMFVINTSFNSPGGVSLKIDALVASESPVNNPKVYFVNNTVLNNNAQAWGATIGGLGIAVDSTIDLWVINNNLWGNSNTDLHVYHPAAENYRLWNNNFEILTGSEPGSTSNNVNVEPVYDSCGFLCLDKVPSLDSPLADGGLKPNLFYPWSPSNRDVRGKARISGPTVDIGAYENHSRLFSDRFEQ